LVWIYRQQAGGFKIIRQWLKPAQAKTGAGQNWRRPKLAQAKTGAGQNWRRPKPARNLRFKVLYLIGIVRRDGGEKTVL
jgi:hypothetical protein